MVKIQVGDREATLHDLEWSSTDQALLTLLTALLPPDGPTGFDPDPDYTVAAAAAEMLNGTIVESDAVVEDSEDVIY